MENNPEYWKFVFRLMDYVRLSSKSGDELLNTALEGRPKTKESVIKLYEIASRHFDRVGNSKVIDAYHDACITFLEQAGVTNAEKMLAPKQPEKVALPKSTLGVLKELEEL